MKNDEATRLLGSAEFGNSLLEGSGNPHRRLEPFGWLYGSFIIINAMVGGGILSLPEAMAQSGGLIVGIPILLSILFLSLSGFIMVGYCVQEDHVDPDITYPHMLRRYLGPSFGHICAIGMGASSFLNTVTYIKAINENVEKIMTTFWPSFTDSHQYMPVIIFMILFFAMILPLCLVRHVGKLKQVSTIASFGVLYIMGLVIAFLAKSGQDQTMKPENPISVSGVLSIVPVVSFSFAAVPVGTHVFARIQPYGVKTICKATFFAFSGILGLYLTVSICVYRTYGSDIPSNFLLEFPTRDPAVVIGIVIYSLKLSVEIPLYLYMGKVSIMTMITDLTAGHSEAARFTSKHQMRIRTCITLAWLAGALTMAYTISDLLIATNWSGVLLTILSYWMPTVCLFAREIKYFSILHVQRAAVLITLSIAVAALGTFMFGVALMQNILNPWSQ